MRAEHLPPDLNAAAYAHALAGFAAVVGSANVITGGGALAAYSDPFAPGDPAAFRASAAVLPANVDEIQSIVAIANENGIPLWTVSTGRNFAYGGAAPRLSGSVVLDLTRMNRILVVNEPLAYALVEPGVTYFDLHDHLSRHHPALWLDPAASGWGSVVGNALERGFGYTPYGDHASTQCGMEVVLANGEVVRTGMGAISTSTSWQSYKPGYGPSFDSIFMQSNYGIVTKMGLWLMPAPATFRLCEVQVRNDGDLGALVDALRPLRLDQTIRNYAVIEGALRRGAGISPRSRWYDGDGPMPEAAIDSMIRQLGIGRWNLHFGLYGDDDVVAAQERVARRAFARIAGASFEVQRYTSHVPGAANAPRGGGDLLQAGVPGMSAFRMLDWRGGSGAHVDFSPVCPFTGSDALRLYSLAKARTAEYGFDYYGGFTAGERHLHHIVATIFNRDDPRQASDAGDLQYVLLSDAHAAGYGVYRAHVAYMDVVASQYDFNGHALRRLSETIKDAIDPNGILSPGKQGIWPRGWRHRRDRRAE
jgi:4-cresol dehydrogenase (hydroxylating) flavoprotein subunit